MSYPDASPNHAMRIKASGSGSVERTPDWVDIVMEARRLSQDARRAQAEVEEATAATIVAVRQLGLAGLEVQTERITMWHQAVSRGEEVPSIQASLTTRFRTTDIESVSRVIDTALGAGCSGVERVTFGIHDAAQSQDMALTAAIQAALRNAEVVAGAMGMRVTRVVEATGGRDDPESRFASLGRASQQAPVEPGKVSVSASAVVVCEAGPTSH